MSNNSINDELKMSRCSFVKGHLTSRAPRKTSTGQLLHSSTPTWRTFITTNRQQAAQCTFSTSASPENLQGRQLEVYTTVKDHFESDNPPPLRVIVTGTAGTGKSYLIQCIRLLLGDKLTVAAPTGVASFIIEGTTLYALLHLPTRREFKRLEGKSLATASTGDDNHQIPHR